MPRSFMIANRRFDDQGPLGDDSKFHSTNSSNNISDFNYDRMYHSNAARKLARCHLNSESPLCTKRVILQRRVADKGVSDGESDSGCSTLTEGSQELVPELEYSWDCPSGFSLLLELMTQSPLKHSGRDVLDLSSDVRSPERRLSREDFDVRSVDESKVARLEEHFVSPGSVGHIESTNMHFRLSPQQIISDLKSSDKYVFDEGISKSEINDFKGYVSGENSPRDFTHSRGLDLSVTADNQKYTTPVYDDFCLAEQGTKYHAQRRISFDSYYNRLESPSEQPIDYSQLSSRRKETSERVKKEEKQEPQDYSVRVRESQLGKGESSIQVRQMSDEGPRPMESKFPPATTPKYEFILSPKMDGNGNLVLHQNQQQNYSSFVGSSPDHKPTKGIVPPSLSASYPSYENKGYTGSYMQQSSPLSGSPASPIRSNSEQKNEFASDMAKKKIDQEDAVNVRAQIPYHPKLKYLLAASQYAKSKVQQEESRMQAKSPGSPPSYHQSILFSQDQNAQVEKIQKATGHKEDFYIESDVKHSQLIPSCEKFQTAVHNHHNANLFIFNPATSINSQTSTIDISEGSITFNEQQNHPKEIQPSELKSLPNLQISKSYNGNYNSDQVSFDQAHQSPMAMSPSSPDQPLSPATLRDQQSALSELLFSTNRKPGVDPYACADCGKRYSTSSNLARHRQTHRSVCDKKARKCPHCDKVYVSMPAYSMHVRTHNQGCECPHCGKKFSRPWLLQGHIRTHTGEKPFGCPQCGKSFADKSNLRAHIQTHSTEKPYVCGRCGKAFALKSYLYKHEESSCMRGQRFRR